MNDTARGAVSRRQFVTATAVATAGLALPGTLRAATSKHRADALRVGLVGCGGRGTGAARDCLRAGDDVVLVAMGDLFPDRLERCRTNLARVASEDADFAKKYQVPPEASFSGFDAYTKVLAADIDLVILATPPGFRPAHLAAAVEAGKHVFMEKPVAVDPAGVRSVIASADAARARNLAIVAGTQRRHDPAYVATMRRVHDGAIGDIVSGQVYWNQGGLWNAARQPSWSDAEWQIRNWLYFTWLSGDHIVEQHIHNLDVANWALGAHPVRAVGVGGRQWRTDAAYGHIFDHFAVDFEYPDGARVLSMCRQIDGTANHIGERFVGTRGSTDASSSIQGAVSWTYDGEKKNPYVQEHVDLLASIRSGQPLNEGRQVAESTLTAIMGREAAYTGQVVTWDDLLNAPQELAPPRLGFGPLEVPPVPMPGRTKLARTWNEA
ncbi:MAG TPA: Gfo/Idh/MocA family oxidoreductase [Gemmatimonadaceae bacterium]|nr:Gfo/Idh/MocA family oxidoreductase [Gemmatimonadaceae bacterium]